MLWAFCVLALQSSSRAKKNGKTRCRVTAIILQAISSYSADYQKLAPVGWLGRRNVRPFELVRRSPLQTFRVGVGWNLTPEQTVESFFLSRAGESTLRNYRNHVLAVNHQVESVILQNFGIETPLNQ